ncbi:hypothetical protein TorRG33x02_179500, partial [Trema orientale]
MYLLCPPPGCGVRSGRVAFCRPSVSIQEFESLCSYFELPILTLAFPSELWVCGELGKLGLNLVENGSDLCNTSVVLGIACKPKDRENVM